MAQNGNENSNILYRLLAACKKEQESGQLMVSLDKCSERVSNYTGLPVSVIEGIIRRVQDQEKVFNLDKHILLMTSIKMVLKMFVEPTFENVYESFTKNYKVYFTKDKNTISAPDFFAQINSLHYELRKTKSNSYVLMENPQVTFERNHYLSKIKKHRIEKKNIYFIDEKVINEKLENRKLVNVKDNTAANEYVFFLMMSSNGYEHGLFTTVASDDVYKRWIENIVIPMLKPCSIIVMTNCYLHDDDKSRITEYDTKAKMWQWLRDHDVPSSTSMLKAELWDLIKKCTDTTKTRTVDKIFQYHGYEVLHLPSTFEEISPIEFMWEKIKTDPSLTNNANIQSAKDNLYEYLSTLQLSVWSSFLRKSFQVEEEIYNLDNEIENFFEIVCDIENNTDLKCVCKNSTQLF